MTRSSGRPPLSARRTRRRTASPPRIARPFGQSRFRSRPPARRLRSRLREVSSRAVICASFDRRSSPTQCSWNYEFVEQAMLLGRRVTWRVEEDDEAEPLQPVETQISTAKCK
ncbi:hypothetical protein GE061_019459 [Apolygus lucorum]|uniref:Uncharacterized protein n=1 Tax=Apolygus lucorum TaxID=248454 RepID=A0A6A4JN50_APOLU|nr:hypothetical protein GE061_019459 [Apolygus lucorum]